MTARGDDRKLMHYIASHGFMIVKSAKGHWMVKDGEGRHTLAVAGGTPSDWRSRRNFLRDLRRQACLE